MTTTKFDPMRLPEPDSLGFFMHPDVPGEEEDDDVAAMLREIGFEFSTVCFDIAPMENAPAATSATASSRKPGVEHGN